MGWAMTLANLGAARMTLAEVTESADVAVMALNDFDEVVNFFQEASHCAIHGARRRAAEEGAGTGEGA